MKLFASLLFVGTFAAVTSSQAQGTANPPPTGSGNSATQNMVDTMSGIHRPTPTPGTTATAKVTGPLEAGLFKDAKAKSAATTFGPSDTVYLVCTNVTAKKGDKLGASWYGGKKEKKISSSTSAVPNDGVYNPSFNLAPAKGGSPAGTYRAEFIQNGKVVKNLKFTVQ